MKSSAFIILFLFIFLHSFADEADSIAKAIEHAKDDTNKVNLLIKSFELTRDSDPEKAGISISQAITLAEQLDFEHGLLTAYRNKGVFLNVQGKPAEAMALLGKGLELARKSNDKSSMGLFEMSIGTVNYDQGRFKEALEHILNSLKLREQANDTKGIADSYIWLGIVTERGFKDYPKAISYYRQALSTYQKAGLEESMAYSYTNIGNVYYTTNQFDSSLYYHLKSLEIKKKYGSPLQLGLAYNNIANVYTDLKQYDKAIENYELSLKYREQAGDKNGIATCLVNIGTVYAQQKKYDKAESYIEQGLQMALQTHFKEVILNAYDVMAQIMSARGNYRSSLAYYQKYIAYKDSVYNTDVSEQMAEMQTKYETEKKDLEISKKTLELQNTTLELNRKRTQVIILILSLLVLAGAGYLFYNRYKNKQRQKLDAEIIRQQNLRNKAIIEAEERERIRIAKDLHDGVGQQMAAVKMNLSSFSDKIKDEPNVKDQYAALMDMADDAIKEVRTISHNMMPNALIRFGLASAAREFIDKIASTGLLECNLQIVGIDRRLEGTVETVLYRVLQECVSNIIKHAGASQVSIQLIKDDSQLTMMIEDNGKGFDTASLNEFPGIGVKNIISRVQYLNGSVHFDSYPGKGTTVIIEIPEQSKAAA